MSVKNTATLIQNHSLAITFNGAPNRYNLSPNAVTKLADCSTLAGHRSSGFNELSNYFEDEKKKPGSDGVVLYGMDIQSAYTGFNDTQHYDMHKMNIQSELDKNFLERLCRIFPRGPVLEIQGKIQGKRNKKLLYACPATAKSEITIEKRIELKDMLASLKLSGDSKLTQSFSTESAAVIYGTGTLTFSINIEWEEKVTMAIQIDRVTFFENLIENESTKDLAILGGNGATVKCHRMIFAAQSKVLSAMVSSSTGMKESQTGVVEMKENSEEGIKLLLRYLYGLELPTETITSALAVELFETAHKYELSHLQSSLEELLLEKDGEWFTPDLILELYFYIRGVDGLKELRDHCLDIMAKMNNQKLRTCEEFKKLDPDSGMELLGTLVALWQEKGGVK